MQGLIPEKHFDGGGNLQKDSGKADLATILIAMQEDFVASLGIKGVQVITLDDADAIAAADATDLATSLTLANELKLDYNGMAALSNDVREKLVPVQEVPIAAPAASLVTLADAIDLPTVLLLANDLKAKYNALAVLLTEIKDDLNTESTVTIVAADAVVTVVIDATDQTEANALLIDIKVQYAIALTLINEVKTDLNAALKITLATRSLPFLG